MANQSYTGGTEVQAGTLTLGTATHPLGNGNATQTVTLKENTTLNMNGNKDNTTCCYNYELYQGSTLNAGNVTGRWIRQFGSLVLYGDATFSGSNHVLVGTNYGSTPCLVTLNGHTLYLNLSNDTNMRGFKTLDAGQVVFRAGGASFYGTTALPIDLSTATLGFEESGFFFNANDLTVSNLYFRSTSNKKWHSQGLGQAYVLGRYIAGDFRAPFTMASGSTLDLSEMTGTWNASGTAIDKANQDRYTAGLVSFADDAEIMVDLSGRTDLHDILDSASQCVVTWPSEPSGVTFRLDARSAAMGFRIYPVAEGLRLEYHGGTMLFFR